MTQPTELTTGAATFEEAIAWRHSQVAEYSAWVAAQDIYVGNALGYVKGDSVPASNVIAYNYDTQGLVERPDGWTDPVPGDGIDDAPTAAPSTVDSATPQPEPTPENTAVKHTPPKAKR